MKGHGIQNVIRTAILAAVAVLTIAGMQHTLGMGVARADGGCRQVSGSISANLVTNPNVSTGLVLGTVTGDLAGATMATFTQSAGTGGVIDLVLHHNDVTFSRDTLSTNDTGTLTPISLPTIYRLSVNYTITGGTGKFAGATGHLENHGEADLITGLLTLTYSGEVCTPQN